MPLTHATELRVRYAETDRMGIVYYANYLVWCEVGRVEFMRALGGSYAELEAQGYGLAVAEATVRYLAPARFDDLVRIETSLVGVRSRAVTFDYVISHAETGTRLRDGAHRARLHRFERSTHRATAGVPCAARRRGVASGSTLALAVGVPHCARRDAERRRLVARAAHPHRGHAPNRGGVPRLGAALARRLDAARGGPHRRSRGRAGAVGGAARAHDGPRRARGCRGVLRARAHQGYRCGDARGDRPARHLGRRIRGRLAAR